MLSCLPLSFEETTPTAHSLLRWSNKPISHSSGLFLRTDKIDSCPNIQAQRLNWLFSKLGGEGAGMMDVLYCVLNDSPEALNMMQEEHIRVIISLLEKFGRDPKVIKDGKQVV